MNATTQPPLIPSAAAIISQPPGAPIATVIPPRRGASIKTWLLRIFLIAFLLAIATPVAIAFALFHISGDTRALRNAVVDDTSGHWKKRIEVNIGSLPFVAARLALPFVKGMDPDIQRLATSINGVEISVQELIGSRPDRARILTEADHRMTARGWDRAVAVFEHNTAVAIYIKPSLEGDVKISALVLEHKTMIAATGHGNLKPILEVALKKANEQIPAEFNHQHTLAKK